MTHTTHTWKLGDVDVSRIGYGAMQLPGWPAGKPAPRDRALAVLRRAVELGVNHIDTAAFYKQDGVSANELIRAALHPYPPGLTIATKVGPAIDLPGFDDGTTPDALRAAVERNLAELGVDRLDLVNLRVGTMDVSDEPVTEPLQTLAALRDEGLIEHIGLSNLTARRVVEGQRVTSIACVQNHYNVRHRDDDELIDSLAAQGIGYVPYFPLGGHVDEDVLDDPALTELAGKHNATPAQIALAWLLHRSPNIVLIPGTSSVGHLEQNVAVADIELSEDDLAKLVS